MNSKTKIIIGLIVTSIILIAIAGVFTYLYRRPLPNKYKTTTWLYAQFGLYGIGGLLLIIGIVIAIWPKKQIIDVTKTTTS
jgi:protein-S-isoprenylcysteine O-methyltransferase Ste14